MLRFPLAILCKFALLGYWLVLTIATHIPPTTDLPSVETSDKILHAAAYLILAFLLTASWELNSGRLNARHLTFAWIAVAVWAAIDELTQIPVGRVADFWDWLADVAGAAAGILLFVAVRQFIERRNASG